MGERFFPFGQPSWIPVTPELELTVRCAGPQQVSRPPPLHPDLGSLPDLIPKLRGIGILGLPPHQTRPVGQERFVNDLHPAVNLLFVPFPRHLVGGQEARIDQHVQHAVC
jgi:hypothetical protein